MNLTTLLVPLVTLGALSQTPARAPAQPAGGSSALQLGPRCDRRTPINSLPVTISASGSYYVTGALTGTGGSAGITIAASDVTIDLNGFALTGVAGSLQGIVRTSGDHIAIRNGTIRDWDQEGIQISSANAVHLEGLTVAGNGGSAGIVVDGAGTVKRVVADDNAGAGMLFGSISTESHFTVSDCVATANGAQGYVANASGGMTDTFAFDDCVARSNGTIGFEIRDAGAVRGCTATGNGDDGFALVRSTAENCVSNSNTVDGFDLFASIATSCRASENGGDGFDLVRVNQVRFCNASGNVGAGILCTFERNLVDSNLLVLNTGFGVVSTDARNTIVRNTAVDNTAGAYSASGARFGPVQSPSTATSAWANF
jgi:hypothetical protein